MSLGEKAMLCLRIAAARGADGDWTAERDTLYREACERFSEKAVCTKFEQLAAKDYIEYGVSARTGWPTEKGRDVLVAAGYPVLWWTPN